MIQITRSFLVFILALIGIIDSVTAQYGAPEHFYLVNGIVVDEITREPIQNIQLNDSTANQYYTRQSLSDTNGCFQFMYNTGWHKNPLDIKIQAIDIDGNQNGGTYLSEKFLLNAKAKDFTDEGGRGWSYETAYKDTIIIALRKEKKKRPKAKKDTVIAEKQIYTQENKAADTVATNQATKEPPKPLPNNNNQSLVLYPNPTKNRLNLKYECTEEGILIKEIRILSTEGKLMLREEVLQTLSYFTREYNIGSWAKGMYFIQFITENAMLTEQFIKK